MKKLFRARYVLLALTLLLVAWVAEYSYTKNYVCAPGDHPIQSEAVAIKQAKIRFSRARYDRDASYGPERPELVVWDQKDDCCRATRTRNIYGVIIWEVLLQGETVGEATTRRIDAVMSLSNCGTVFVDGSFISAKPEERGENSLQHFDLTNVPYKGIE
jgi:hypothetical protein